MGALLQGTVMAGFLLAGKLRPRIDGQPLFHRDLWLHLLNGLALFIVRVSLIAWIAANSSLGWLSTDWVPGPWGQALLGFVLLDLSRYWLHYAGHRVPFLWQFHRVHHSAEVMDATVGLRMHVVDFLQLSALPILLFNVLLDTHAWHPAVIPAVLAVGVVFDGFQHANLRIDPTSRWFRVWNLVLNNPHFHSWHHTADGHLRDGNYGNTLIIWDRLFGTDVSGPRAARVYGVTSEEALGDDPVSWQLLRTRDRPPLEAG